MQLWIGWLGTWDRERPTAIYSEPTIAGCLGRGACEKVGSIFQQEVLASGRASPCHCKGPQLHLPSCTLPALSWPLTEVWDLL